MYSKHMVLNVDIQYLFNCDFFSGIPQDRIQKPRSSLKVNQRENTTNGQQEAKFSKIENNQLHSNGCMLKRLYFC